MTLFIMWIKEIERLSLTLEGIIKVLNIHHFRSFKDIFGRKRFEVDSIDSDISKHGPKGSIIICSLYFTQYIYRKYGNN